MNHRSIESARQNYLEQQQRGLHLNIARGNPSAQQLDLSSGFFSSVTQQNCHSRDGIDVRNYGELKGISEAREWMSWLLGVSPEQVIIGGSSSLTVMYDVHTRLLLTTPPDGSEPWFNKKNRKFLCPCPGYDRHFKMTEGLGYTLIPIPMKDDGPDMDQVRAIAEADPDVLGIWCVPKYSNPTGVTYSESVCRQLASLKTAAPDFRIFWDNAYSLHTLSPDGETDTIPDILQLCQEAGHPNRAFCFASTSKIIFAGGGLAALATSQQNREWFSKQQTLQMICTDKVNQLRHVHFLPTRESLLEHMKKEAIILAPKFQAFQDVLERHFNGSPEISWTRPRGGYFIGLTLPVGTAARTVQLASEAGLKLTPAGAAFPYGKDPQDSFLRIAPSFPPLAEIVPAAEVLCASIELACAEKLDR